MTRVAFGLILVAIALVLIVGTNRAGSAVQRGIFYSDPTYHPGTPCPGCFRFVAPSPFRYGATSRP